MRHDKSSVGDIVVWHEDYAEHFFTEQRDTLGEGPFVINTVFDREYIPPYDDEGQSNWSSMGHTQHVHIDGSDLMWSGAYFKLKED